MLERIVEHLNILAKKVRMRANCDIEFWNKQCAEVMKLFWNGWFVVEFLTEYKH